MTLRYRYDGQQWLVEEWSQDDIEIAPGVYLRHLSANEVEMLNKQFEPQPPAPTKSLDTVATRTLDQAVRFHGIRAVLAALEQICDDRARVAADNFNTVAAKQWANWAGAIATGTKLPFVDPGRE